MYFPDYYVVQFADQRRKEAEEAAANHRLLRQIGATRSVRTAVGQTLIKLGRRLTADRPTVATAPRLTTTRA